VMPKTNGDESKGCSLLTFSSRQKIARAKFLYLTRQFAGGAKLVSEPQTYGIKVTSETERT
jgi:hypothetical protein